MAICNLPELRQRLKPGSCLLGLDLGSKLIGVAVSDPGLVVASPLTTITRAKFSEDVEQIATIMGERTIGGLIIGLPREMDGKEGSAAQSARSFAANMQRFGKLADPDLPIVYWDERLSTVAVTRVLLSDDMTRQRRARVVDKAAAAYILQGALDALKNMP
jgi:putative Holliday junction resolvase